ncbi:MAG: DUF362 domain-containing protein [Candidatus Ranarchaeia archaeon]|jgi:uncharacterized protein (DUF362 family)
MGNNITAKKKNESPPTVAITSKDAFTQAISDIGGIDDLNSSKKEVVIKVGIYNTSTGICTTVKTLQDITSIFNKSKCIRVAETDSGAGPGLQRLKIWEECYSDRVLPSNLSDDENTKTVEVAGEQIAFSHILFEPNTFVSTHVPRRYEKAGNESLMNLGSIIKNLLGLIPDIKKYRFHKQLPTTLLDIYEAIGGIELAILDGTRTFLGYQKKKTTVPSNFLLVGRDAFAVEAVGAYLVGFEPTEMPLLQEAQKRNLGEINLEKINIVGDIETPRKQILQVFETLSKSK